MNVGVKSAADAMQPFPCQAEDIDLETLNRLVSKAHPGARVDSFEINEVRGLGKMVSTAGRVRLRLHYADGSPELPEPALLKMVIDQPGAPGMIYETEIMIYERMLESLNLERPLYLGGTYDHETERFALLLEDLTPKQALFPNALETQVSLERVRRTLDFLATLHAHYWENPRLLRETGWLSSLVDGVQFQFMDANAVPVIESWIPGNPYRRQLLERMGKTAGELWNHTKAVHRFHHERLPQTLLHGDTGVHNSYHLPDGRVGMVDWQLAVRGAWPHDIHYIICTALDTETRRKHERDLIAYYLDRLAALGVRDLPSVGEAMIEYARSIVWGITIGWLMAGDTNYGPEILKANLDRLVAAAEDLGTFALADEVT